MKLISIDFKNINALKGGWQIDFSDDAFYGGIFSIIGQTGAGKTSLLDAICLALYGMTPRLGKITKSDNALMSLGTAECHSEVVFELQGRRYYASFSQRRAKNSPTGALQEPKREFGELIDSAPKIIASKSTQVQQQLQSILGMDFAQFSRSVMLAQGSFSAFLQANAGDRAAILEKITGTAIYARLGTLAYQTWRDKQDALDEMRRQLAAMSPIDDDALADLERNYTHLNAQKQPKQARLEQLQKLKQCKQQHRELSARIDSLTSTQAQKQAKLNAFAPRLNQLQRARRANTLSSDFEQLKVLTTSITESETALNTLHTALPKLSDAKAQALQIAKNAANAHQQAQQDYDAKRPIFKQARLLDADLATLAQQILNLENTQADQLCQLNDSDDKLNTSQQALTDRQAKVQKIQEALSTLSPFAQLQVERVGVHCRHYYDAFSELITHNQALDESKQQILQIRKTLETQNTALDKLKADASAWQQQSQKVRQTLFTLCAASDIPAQSDTSLAFLDDWLNGHHKRLRDMGDLQHLLDKRETLKSTLDKLDNETQTLNAQVTSELVHITRLKTDIQADNVALADLTQARQKAEAHLQTLRELQGLQLYFDKLHDGRPCPLCGSEQHPYKHSNHTGATPSNAALRIRQQSDELSALDAQLTALNTRLNAANLQMQTAEAMVNQHQLQLTKLNKSHDEMRHAYQDNRQAIQGLLTALPQLHQALSSTLTGELDAWQTADMMGVLTKQQNAAHAHHEQLQAQKQALDSTLQRLTQVNSQIELNTQAISHQNSLLDSQKQTWQKHRAHFKNALNKLQQSAAHVLVLAQQFSLWLDGDMIAQMQALQADIDYLCARNSDKPSAADLDAISERIGSLPSLSVLEQRLNQLQETLLSHKKMQQAHELEHSENSQAIQHLSMRIDELQAQKQQLQAQLKTQSDTLNKLQTTLSEQQQSRQALLQGDVDAVEEAMRSAMQNAQNALNQAQTQAQTAEQAWQRSEDMRVVHESQLNDRRQAHAKARELFDKKRQVADFLDETDFLSALLSDDALQALETEHQAHVQALGDTTQALVHNEQARRELQDAFSKLLNELSQGDSPLPSDSSELAAVDEEALDEALNQASSEFATLMSEIGALNVHRQNAHAQKNASQTLKKNIAAAESDISIWSELSALIGSHDGKKYRTFVQSMTLDIVLGLANDVLAKMNDRYVLIRHEDSKQELGIDVVDLHQGGAVRSSKNLSGGESFLVSLALALGLADINSERMHIDSLFLDEGFGTLDEDALDVALSALSEIQQMGKSIGIISHVAALKERIGTQIIVEKKSGGVSILKGAGVKKQ